MVKIFSALILLSCLGAVSSNYAIAASNHSDTRFERYSTGDGGDIGTSPRIKHNTTSMYAYNDKSTLGFYASGAGSWGSGTVYTQNVSTGYKNIPRGQSKFITQYVKETKGPNGKAKPSYSHALLLISPGSHSSKTWVSFLWSPDSI